MNIPGPLWPEVSRLFDEAIALPAGRKEAWLDELAERHPELAPHVRHLLDAHESPEGGDRLSGAPSELIVSALAQRAGSGTSTLVAGQMLGSYRLVAPLGEGGMAAVWLAEQTVNVQRRVALKVPHRGLEDATATTRRYAQERDFLAGLEHSHIARLYDAGVSAEGVPYLAMEWIDGISICRYADDHGLDVTQRVALFQQVLQAVQFAHARLVIHRDIKPSNILVTPDGQVKLLDFGIARLLDEHGSDEGASLVAPAKAMTPEAASPEQLAGQTLGTASDVYSLGVVLYELLTGRRPYDLVTETGDRSSSALHEALLRVDVSRPSEVAFDKAAAMARGTSVRGLKHALAGDLDAIVGKALMKQAAERYDSAATLAADLERWQARLPVDARRPDLRYRAGRFLARHRVLVAAGTAVAAALCLGLGLALWQARQARQETRQAEAVQGFLIGLFKGSDPEVARGHDVSAKELLDRGAKRLDADLRDQPAVLARLHHEIGAIYVQLGSNLAARPHLERSLQLYQALGLEGSEDAVEAAFNLTEVLSEDHQYGPARQAAERTLALADRHFGSHNRWRLPVRTQLAWMDFEEGHAQAAVDAMVQALADADREDPQPTIEKLKARTTLANARTGLGQYAQARDAFAQVLRDGAGMSGYEVTDRLTDRYNLARTHYFLREYAACTDELASSVPEMDRHIGPRHDRTIKARGLWAQCLVEGGQYQHALAIARENLAYAKAREASDDDVVSLQQLTLAKLLKVAVRPREGLPLLREGLAFMDAKYHEPFWNREIARRLLGELLLEDGQVDEALKTFAVAAANSERIDSYAVNTSYADLLQAQAMALRVRAGPGDANHAIELLGQALAIYDKALGASNVATLRCATQLDWVSALAAPGDASAGTAFASTAERFEATLPPGHVAHAELQWMRAELSDRRGAKADAQAQFAGARVAWRTAMGAEFVAPFTALH